MEEVEKDRIAQQFRIFKGSLYLKRTAFDNIKIGILK